MLTKDEVPAVKVTLQEGEKLYTAEQIQVEFFPRHFIGKRLRFYSEKPDRVVFVPGQVVTLPFSVKVRDGQGYAIVSQITVCGGEIKFAGHEYITENIIEQKTLRAVKKVVCMGEVETGKETHPPIPNVRDILGRK
jgi:hypothetical protein